MVRRDIQFIPYHFYHIYNRGNNRESIFIEDENYIHFLNRLHHYFDPVNIDLPAYCLMPNHFHLLVSPQKVIDLSNIMRSFSISYAKAFNKWCHRVGHVFQGNFQTHPIERDGYLSHICRYIHLNPLKGGLVSMPDQWIFSDYREWISNNEEDKPGIRLRNELFGKGEDYKKFVMDFADEQRVQKELEKVLSISDF